MYTTYGNHIPLERRSVGPAYDTIGEYPPVRRWTEAIAALGVLGGTLGFVWAYGQGMLG